jgi:dehydrogenase/reductase SDR family member 7B
MGTGECWWITGASSGIGEALAVALAARGHRIVLSGRNVPELERVATVCGAENCHVLPFETTDYAAIPDAVERALTWGGRIDALINNAGISQRSVALETDFTVYERIVAVDLLAPIALTQAVLPHMVAAGGGRIVGISSVAGVAGVPMRTAYCAAKHGLIGYLDALRTETAHLGIQVHVVAPGSIRTNVSRNALTGDGGRRGQSDAVIDNGMDPADAARRMMEAFDAGQREMILAEGQELEIAWLRRSDPNALFDRMAAMVAAGYAERMKSGAD